MNKAFTLIELLVVMGIMGLLGTISVGGYQAMQRGMETRGVMQAVDSMLRAAYQRAQIDRQPVVVYYWNETLRSETDTETALVVGRAVAVRRYGRLSDVRNGLLIDEFADLDQTYPVSKSSGGSTKNAFYLYPMDNPSTSLQRSLVSGTVTYSADSVQFYSGTKNDRTANQQLPGYGFSVVNGFNSWHAGMSYGMQFLELELPHNFIFGSSFSSDVSSPVQGAGVLVYDVKKIDGSGATGSSGANTVQINELKQSGGSLKATPVGTTRDPAEKEG